MRLRHINRTATLAWSPGQHDSHGPLLAAGTVAGALDASFSATTELEIFDLNLNSKFGTPGYNKLRKIGSVACTARFNRLAWGSIPGDASRPLGILASGMENGELNLWNPTAIVEGNAQKSMLMRQATHSGPVRGLDFNSVQPNLLASGASQGEIFIWDLNNPAKHFTPGAKSQRLEDITAVAWNEHAAHIIATASNNGNTVIWDLRQKRELLTLVHPGGRKPITSIAWNPAVATQIVTASDDDNAPGLLIWNLQNAAAPQMALHGHQKGVLSMAWCPKDSDLLLSCGKDNSTLAWNPNTGEMIGELAHTSNWSFNVQWCPRNPDLVAVSSFDGNLAVHSLQSSGADEDEVPPTPVQVPHSDDPFSAQNLNPTQPYVSTAFALRQPPKWLRRPVGATFGFGGKLVTFDQQSRNVLVRTVPTELAFAQRVDELEAVMADDQIQSFKQFCERRSVANDEGDAVNDTDRETWKFMKVMLESGAREQVVEYLGLDRSNLGGARLAGLLQKLKLSAQTKPEELVEPAKPSAPAPPIADASKDATVPNGLGNLFGASQVEFPDIPQADAPPSYQPVPVSTRKPDPFSLYPTKPGQDADIDILITKAVILGDFETAVDVALGANRLSDAMMLAVSGGSDLLLRTQQEYFRRQKKEKTYIRVLQSVVQGDLTDIVENGHLDGPEGGWKDILALICTYGTAEESSELFSKLGKRLEEAGPKVEALKAGAPRENKKFAAVLCYLAAGDLKRVVDIWGKKEIEEEHKLLKGAGAANKKDVTARSSHMVALQSLIEKVTVFRKAIGFADPELSNPSGFFQLESLYDHYAEYAESIASQGKLDMAWTMLELVPEGFRWSTKLEGHGPPPGTEDAIAVLRNRVYRSGGLRKQVTQPPAFPYHLEDYVGAQPQVQAQYQDPQQQHQPAQAYQSQANSAYPYYNQTTQQDLWGQQSQAATYPAQQTYGAVQSSTQQYPSTYGNYQTSATSLYDQVQPPTSAYPSAFGSNMATSYAAPPAPTGPTFQNTAPATHFNDPPFVPQHSRLAAKPAPVAAPITTALNPALGVPPPQTAAWGAQNPARSPTPLAPPPTSFAPGSAYAPAAPAPASRILSPPPINTFGGSDYGGSYGQTPTQGLPSQYPGQQQQPGTFDHSQQQSVPHTVTRSTSLTPAPPPKTPTPQRPPSAAPVSKYPPGDRSHIPAAHKPIYEGLQKYMVILKSMSTAPQQKRIYDDSEKRISVLYDQLNAEEVPADVVAQMLELVKALEVHDYTTASSIQVDLVTTRFDVTGKWMQVVKRLIGVAESAAAGVAAPQTQQHQQPPLSQQAQQLPPPPQQQQHAMPPPPPQGSHPPQQQQYMQYQQQQQHHMHQQQQHPHAQYQQQHPPQQRMAPPPMQQQHQMQMPQQPQAPPPMQLGRAPGAPPVGAGFFRQS
ncbi:hypothetical protein PhCBS80983_g00603 [Powellomyces hirtus]|uniref:Protein transport protein SEC31 n=1 Tax=Powellomyces hirtus TaxID=109895 RepID=A0A507EE70_9FUNG|nr:hypothetical protein PhCBS80983_g00603 [Powellomyces hirtus]